jgi:hypothetical protein
MRFPRYASAGAEPSPIRSPGGSSETWAGDGSVSFVGLNRKVIAKPLGVSMTNFQ